MISQVTFDYSSDQIESLADQASKQLLSELDSIAKKGSPQCLAELEWALVNFSNSLGSAVFLKYVSPRPEIRQAADKVEMLIQKLMVDVFTREDLFLAVKKSEKDWRKRGKVEEELLDEYLFNFKRNGLGLEESSRTLYINKKKRLVEVESEFSQNLLKENTILEFSREELEGLPESFLKSLNQTSQGKYEITLSYPHVTPFMENVVSTESRRKLGFHFNNRGGQKNKALLEEAVKLRKELAQMLGFSNHAELVLSRRMALTPKKVSDFLEDLSKKLESVGIKERQALLDLKKQLFQDSSALKSYEWRFLHNQLLKKQFDVDPLEVQQYFPLNHVLDGMFEIYQKLLGVTFQKDSQSPVWYPSVTKYSVLKDGKVISHFFMDLFPREGKYGHAAAFTLVSGFRDEKNVYQMPFSAIVANFSSPTQDKPSLLMHSEVETLFHEFGHIMHQVLTTARFPSFSGTGVKTDFVEAPSQMLENWVWDKAVLKKLSSHFQRPQECLPDSLIDKMLAAKNLNSGLHYLRQITFGLIDLELHTDGSRDSSIVYEDLMQNVLGIPVQEKTLPQASFGHLMGGYDAGYYGYLWAEVFAQDMFSRFETEGLLNSKTGEEYRKWILEPGGEQHPSDLIRGFLKREPNSEAFLRGIGL